MDVLVDVGIFHHNDFWNELTHGFWSHHWLLLEYQFPHYLAILIQIHPWAKWQAKHRCTFRHLFLCLWQEKLILLQCTLVSWCQLIEMLSRFPWCSPYWKNGKTKLIWHYKSKDSKTFLFTWHWQYCRHFSFQLWWQVYHCQKLHWLHHKTESQHDIFCDVQYWILAIHTEANHLWIQHLELKVQMEVFQDLCFWT